MKLEHFYKKMRLILIVSLASMSLIFLSTLGLTYNILYDSFTSTEEKQLQGMVSNEAQLLKALIESNVSEYQNLKNLEPEVLVERLKPMLQELYVFGDSGEFVVGVQVDDNIRFLTRFRFPISSNENQVPLRSTLAEPMRLALADQMGTIKDLDYRGVPVLAAYQPVGILNLGMVAKIDIEELDKPFWDAALKSSFLALVLIGLGYWLIMLKSKPVIKLMEESQQNLFALIENAPDAMMVVDSTGHIVHTNNRFDAIFGYQPTELNGQTLTCLLPEHIRATHESFVLEYMKNPVARSMGSGLNLTGVTRSGHEFPAEISLSPIMSLNKLYVVAAIRDLTERRRLEEQFLQSQKMEAMGILTGGLAHDFNNLLGIITGYATLLRNKFKDDPSMLSYADEIHHAGTRGANLIKRLLAFSKKQTIEPEGVCVNELLLENEDFFKKSLTPKIKLILDLAEENWWSLLDVNEFIDAILNIVINAKLAMGGHTKNPQLIVRTRNIQFNKETATGFSLAAGDYIEISLIDNGVGIKSEDLDKIFEPFYTTRQQGSGLGLSQVFGFVRRAKGHIEAYSTPGEGARFVIYLPRSTELDGKEVAREISIARGSETILVVDDEKSMLGVIKLVLEEQGYRVNTALSAHEALEQLEKHSIDLVLSDIIMPDMDGFELAIEIQARHPEVKVQFMSGYADISNQDLVDDALRESILMKPLEPESLSLRLRELLDE